MLPLQKCMIRMVHNPFRETVHRRPLLELVLGDGVPEPDTLFLGDLEFERTWLTASIWARKRARAPRRS